MLQIPLPLRSRWLRLARWALAFLLPFLTSAESGAATLEVYPAFQPTRLNFDGRVMIGSGSPGNYWLDGVWSVVPGSLLDVSADGTRVTSNAGTYVYYKYTLTNGVVTGTLGLSEMFAGGTISPGGGTVVGQVLNLNTTSTDYYGETYQAASWGPTGAVTRYRPYEDGACAPAARPWFTSSAFLVTNAGIIGVTELFRCPRAGPAFIDAAYVTRWPGPTSLGEVGSISGLVASDDGSVLVVRKSGGWAFVQGSGGFVPVPEASGCTISALSANAGTAVGNSCLWTAALGWRQLVDVLREDGRDVDG